MNKIKYIEQLVNSDLLLSDGYNIIYSLISTLTPKQVCDFLDLSFEQNYKLRQWIVKKIASDIRKEYLPYHQKLVSKMIDMLELNRFPKRDSCAFSLNIICDSLPSKEQNKIINTFLNSRFIRLRNRAYKRFKTNWNKKYQKTIEKNWYEFKDPYCINVILKHFPTDYLLVNYKTYLKDLNPRQLSRLFRRISEKDTRKVNELKNINEISYSYVLVKIGKKISNQLACQFLKNNYKDDNISLLIWCFGQMGLWNAIVDFEKNYKEKIRQSTIMKINPSAKV